MTTVSRPVVFISYSHDSDGHREKVLGLSERLRRDGFETRLDQYVNGTPPEGWPRWMLNQLDEANFVLVVCTETYYRRFRGHEQPDRGKGVDWEGALITQEIYDARSKTVKFVPVMLSPGQQPFIPEPLSSHTHYLLTSESAYQALDDFLHGVAGVEPGEIGVAKQKTRPRGRPLKFDEACDAPAVPQAASAPATPAPNTVRLVRVFVSSPGDVAKERELVDEVVTRINRTEGDRHGVRLETFKWEKNVVPQIGPGPQPVVDVQTPADYDIYLGILAHRFGTPTDNYGSGTEKEFHDALRRWEVKGKPWILFYFNDAEVSPRKLDLVQYAKVCTFREMIEPKGLYATYDCVRGSKDGFYEKLDEHLRQVLHSVLAAIRSSPDALRLPPFVSLENRTTRLLAAYQAQVQQLWKQHWSDSDPETKPPFIDTQELRLLLETEHPERYLHPEYFRVGRGPRSVTPEQDRGDWEAVDRGELAGNKLVNADSSPCDLSRLVITTDAGVGKTITMQWLEAELNQSGASTAAFYLTFSRLPSRIDELLPDLARRMLKAGGSDGEASSQGDAVPVLESLRHQGRLTLLLDALDQEPADGSAALLVRQLLEEPAWRACRIVISGRPYALQRHWSQLFATELGHGWRFVQVDEFTPDEQRRFLGTDGRGEARIEFIPKEAHEILSTPRVLSYLRNLPDADLKKIRTAGDVYWLSMQHLLIEGMQGSDKARRIGLEALEPTPAKVQARSKLRALKLLAAIAFEMTSTLVARTDAAPGEPPTPNFDGEPRNRFPRFRERLRRRLSPGAAAESAGPPLDRDLDGLAALNDFVSQGFFDTTVDGLQELYWRNRSLQEFFTAFWLAQYCTEQDASLLWDWLYQPDQPQTEEYYWVWRFVCEMHVDARDPESWLRAVEPIYRPGDGTIAGTRRSSEFIYRAWQPLEKLIAGGEPAAAKIRDRFRGEFEYEILSGSRGEPARRIAQQFRDSFIEVRAGDFRMGAPPEKQGIGEELRGEWKAYLAREGDPVERARQHLADWSFTPGKRGEEERRSWLEWYAEVFRDQDLDRLENAQFPRNETPAEPIQTVEAFRLCRCPTLNAWYRLFVPGHGEVESSYLAKYRSVSPTPDSTVIFVSWYDAWAFALWARWEGGSCRLPREHEWEFAAKADTPWDQNYWWGDEFDADKCNADRNVGRATTPSPSHANPWGFEDILGNVWEWCEDWYRRVYDRSAVDEASSRVIRGGGWRDVAGYCRSADRSGSEPERRDGNLGFRVAAVPPSQPSRK